MPYESKGSAISDEGTKFSVDSMPARLSNNEYGIEQHNPVEKEFSTGIRFKKVARKPSINHNDNLNGMTE